ncbi:DUF3857 domain-containing protein [bacterium SCSIO 12741]|nr:DUF3857 domain-containing protein [bacterium SCSIO 12741]
MKNSILTALFLFVLMAMQAQEDSLKPYYQTLEWNDDGSRCDWCANDSIHQAEYGIDKMVIEYYYSPTYDYNLVEYRTFHKLVRVHTEKAVNSFNQIYMNLNNAVDLVDARARVIKPNGEVVYLKKEDILEAKNFEEYGRFKYFALEGIEIGSDIEYTYTVLKAPYLDGSSYAFQSDLPHHKVEFRLLAPNNLIFAFQSDNGFPEIQQDTTDTTRNVWVAQTEKIPPRFNEPYSSYEPSLQGIQFKIEENSAGGPLIW